MGAPWTHSPTLPTFAIAVDLLPRRSCKLSDGHTSRMPRRFLSLTPESATTSTEPPLPARVSAPARKAPNLPLCSPTPIVPPLRLREDRLQSLPESQRGHQRLNQRENLPELLPVVLLLDLQLPPPLRLRIVPALRLRIVLSLRPQIVPSLRPQVPPLRPRIVPSLRPQVPPLRPRKVPNCYPPTV